MPRHAHEDQASALGIRNRVRGSKGTVGVERTTSGPVLVLATYQRCGDEIQRPHTRDTCEPPKFHGSILNYTHKEGLHFGCSHSKAYTYTVFPNLLRGPVTSRYAGKRFVHGALCNETLTLQDSTLLVSCAYLFCNQQSRQRVGDSGVDQTDTYYAERIRWIWHPFVNEQSGCGLIGWFGFRRGFERLGIRWIKQSSRELPSRA